MAGDPTASVRHELQPFGRYTLLRKLATGGMGEVHLARLSGAEGFEKLLVIKKIRDELASDAEFVTRFQDEARTLVQLQHGAIAQVFDMGEVNGIAFIALEFVDGKDLKSVLVRCQERGTRVPTAVALYVMLHVLDALGYAHRKKDEFDRDLNLVHRDISPPNVLIAYEGDIKVIDFGLAKSILSLQRTQAGAFVGKFFYMAPEAARHQPLDRRADLFAAGVVLHEVLHGRHILEGLGPGEVMARVVKPSFPRLAGTVPGVSPQLDAIIQKALEPDPAKRFQTAEEMRAPLAAALAELSPGLGPESVSRFMRQLFNDAYAEERHLLRTLREAAGMRRRTADELPVGRASQRSSSRPSTGPTQQVEGEGETVAPGFGANRFASPSAPTFIAPSGSDPTLRRLELPGASGFANPTRETDHAAAVRPITEPDTPDEAEYVPPEEDVARAPTPVPQTDDPSMAPTFFEPSDTLATDARPITAPAPMVTAGPVIATGPTMAAAKGAEGDEARPITTPAPVVTRGMVGKAPVAPAATARTYTGVKRVEVEDPHTVSRPAQHVPMEMELPRTSPVMDAAPEGPTAHVVEAYSEPAPKTARAEARPAPTPSKPMRPDSEPEARTLPSIGDDSDEQSVTTPGRPPMKPSNTLFYVLAGVMALVALLLVVLGFLKFTGHAGRAPDHRRSMRPSAAKPSGRGLRFPANSSAARDSDK
ncbi:MAG: protein kinase [Deltaproteobacteria bacterium]|nr:protein kinase [Deltaproteobacteria bacterium]